MLQREYVICLFEVNAMILFNIDNYLSFSVRYYNVAFNISGEKCKRDTCKWVSG